MKIILICIVVTSVFFSSLHAQKPVKIGVAGLSHSHVVPLLRNMDRNDIEIVGIAERDTALSNRYAKRFGIDQNLIYQSLDEMLEKTKPEGVITFTSIYEHLKLLKHVHHLEYM